METSNIIKHFFLTSRPYSYVSEIVRGLFFALILKESISNQELVLVGMLSFFMWVYFNWQSDWIQKDKGRLVPKVCQCYFPLLLSAISCFWLNSWIGLLGLLFYVVPILVYSVKTTYSSLGAISPFLRGLTVLGHFFFIAFVLSATPNTDALIWGFFFATYKGISNLMGDIRDIETDKYEIPVRFGFSVSKLILRFGFGVGFILLASLSTTSLKFASFFFLAILFLIIEYIASIKKSKYSPAYFGLNAHIATNLFITIHLVYLFWALTENLLLSLFLFFAFTITQYTYFKNPGKYYNFK